MKKILSIILALGLVLSMSLAAMPAAAQTTPCGTIAPFEVCAGDTETYTITFTLTKTLFEGNDSVVIEFPEGFSFGTFVDGEVFIGGDPVLKADLTIAGSTITIPVQNQEFPGSLVIIIPKVKASTTVGEWTVNIGLDRDCCPFEWVCEVDLEVLAKKSTYKLYIDHGVTPAAADLYIPDIAKTLFVEPLPIAAGTPSYYPGITQDYFPPTQYCQYNFWVVMIDYLKEGCEAWGEDAQVRITLVDAPEDAVVTFYIYGFNATFPAGTLQWHGPYASDPFDPAEDAQEFLFPDVPFTLDEDYIDLQYNMTPVLSHATMPGEYTFDIELFTEVDTGECDEEDLEERPLAEKKTYTHMEYQWLDAYEIDLFPKWNLISLPIVPFETDLATALESFAFPELLLGIYQYDTLAGEYDAYPGFGLDEMVDGKGYWMKMAYGGTNPPAGTPASLATAIATWWVFGTDRPGDPPTPVSYDAFEGWNQIGFTSMAPATDDIYLSNWLSYWGIYGYGNIYGWAANTQTYAVQTPGGATLNPGMGYWVNFHYDGEIYF